MADDWKRRIDRLHENLVRRDDPAAWVTEADAVEASYRYPDLLVRGPVFGLAAQNTGDGGHGGHGGKRRPGAPRAERGSTAGPWRDGGENGGWRLLRPVSGGTPQEARDSLNSFLWFRAKDDTDDPRLRRTLLDAVAVLENEPVNEVEVLGCRYRVVRADEFARRGEDGMEPPRPTDPEPGNDYSWEGGRGREWPEVGLTIDPDRDEGLMAGAMKLGLRSFTYNGALYPDQVRRDSELAVEHYPDIALLPVGFSLAELADGQWTPRGALLPSPHDARRALFDGMNEFWPMMYRFDPARRAAHARAAAEFKAAGRADEARVGDVLYRVCRIERAVRCGPDGPEPPRPSDLDSWGPMKLHPTMDDDGTLHYDEG
ncbi:DUF5954 family protein [Streptomyces qinzhouensis]|uniref:Aromatic ring-opening dioxygenase LigA n=1 Tax=Streptomyces qinzhouensis TaxID=2599401 RepID=A0A5B8J7J6_9ACTN|nr:DUF5954 family protein [Streptomyces qinzhouensis]QDY77196.1 hypothetical protein FQU76_12460 [Streptomyces qinzhouensis]